MGYSCGQNNAHSRRSVYNIYTATNSRRLNYRNKATRPNTQTHTPTHIYIYSSLKSQYICRVMCVYTRIKTNNIEVQNRARTSVLLGQQNFWLPCQKAKVWRNVVLCLFGLGSMGRICVIVSNKFLFVWLPKVYKLNEHLDDFVLHF